MINTTPYLLNRSEICERVCFHSFEERSNQVTLEKERYIYLTFEQKGETHKGVMRFLEQNEFGLWGLDPEEFLSIARSFFEGLAHAVFEDREKMWGLIDLAFQRFTERLKKVYYAVERRKI